MWYLHVFEDRDYLASNSTEVKPYMWQYNFPWWPLNPPARLWLPEWLMCTSRWHACIVNQVWSVRKACRRCQSAAFECQTNVWSVRRCAHNAPLLNHHPKMEKGSKRNVRVCFLECVYRKLYSLHPFIPPSKLTLMWGAEFGIQKQTGHQSGKVKPKLPNTLWIAQTQVTTKNKAGLGSCRRTDKNAREDRYSGKVGLTNQSFKTEKCQATPNPVTK